jgi:periplasmic protein TonB
VAVNPFPRAETVTRESLIVLSHDGALVETLQILGHDHDIFTVGAEADLAAQLIAEHAGVTILDAAAVSSPVERLTERLKAQFPDLVLIVAGGIDDQSALAAQITNGTVYRFLHKPVSEQRVKLFVEAAWRRHTQEISGIFPALTEPVVIPKQRTTLPPAALVGAGAAVAAFVLVGAWLIVRKPDSLPAATTSTGTAEAPLAAGRDEVLETLLARADKALAAGALVTPPEDNAADLYKQALLRNANDPRAGGGLEKVIDKLLSAAEQELLAQRVDEAQKLTDQARAIKPDHVRVAFLTAQIAKERERAILMQARQAAATGNTEQAIAILDGASSKQKSTLVAETKRELEQKRFDQRVGDYLRKALDRLKKGDVLEPPQDNARFFVESARAIAPTDPDVKQAQRQLADRILSEARKALNAGNADQADKWIQAGPDAGVSREDITSLTRESQRVRTAAKADAMARMALLFNQRITQGRLVDPASDSAKFYLTQLVQADPSHPSTQLAKQAFAARSLDEARGAVRRQEYSVAKRWLAEAKEAGADDTSLGYVDRDITTAQNGKSGADFVTATSLQLIRYAKPEFPTNASARGLDGWVDVQFTVKRDGTTGDIAVIGAQPVGVFEAVTIDAVRKWRYRPVMRNGQPVDQRAQQRVRFALEK